MMAISKMRVTGGMLIRGAMAVCAKVRTCPRGRLSDLHEEAEEASTCGMQEREGEECVCAL